MSFGLTSRTPGYVSGRNPASLNIVDVDLPENAEPGRNLEPVVTVENRNQEPAPGEDFDLGWVIVTAAGNRIVHNCFVIRPGGTFEADDCSSAVPSCDEGIRMPESGSLTFEIRAGGFPSGTNCLSAASAGSETARTSITVNPPSDGGGGGGDGGGGGGNGGGGGGDDGGGGGNGGGGGGDGGGGDTEPEARLGPRARVIGSVIVGGLVGLGRNLLD